MSLPGTEIRVTVTEESLAGQEHQPPGVPGEALVVPDGQTEQVWTEDPLVAPGLSNLVPEVSFPDPEQSLVFPQPSRVSPEQSLAGQVPERSPLVPELSVTNPEQTLLPPELSPEGPENSAANPEQSEFPTGKPVIPWQPTSPPVHQWTWMTSPLRPNLTPPKSSLAPRLSLSQSAPASTLASQQYPKPTPAQTQAPLGAGRTGSKNRLLVSNAELPLH